MWEVSLWAGAWRCVLGSAEGLSVEVVVRESRAVVVAERWAGERGLGVVVVVDVDVDVLGEVVVRGVVGGEDGGIFIGV